MQKLLVSTQRKIEYCLLDPQKPACKNWEEQIRRIRAQKVEAHDSISEAEIRSGQALFGPEVLVKFLAKTKTQAQLVCEKRCPHYKTKKVKSGS